MILLSVARRRAKNSGWSMVGVTAVAAVAVSSAQAQAPAEPEAQTQASETSTPSEIVVTGSRIIRNGYEAPTPVSVLGVDELNALNQPNIANAVTVLPEFSGSANTTSANGNLSSGATGASQLNLRGLGTERTLVLLDGKRYINADTTPGSSAPDINSFPTALIKRVDVVTGGASAAYGSDALAGVVNFVMDHDFTGLKGQIQGGETTYGDDENIDAQLTYGVAFAGGRGHFIVSGEYYRDGGIRGSGGRPWNAYPSAVIVNPAYGTGAGQTTKVPQYIDSRDVGPASATPGGLITSGALQGTYFGPNGTILNGYNFGTPVGNDLQEGGDWRTSRIDDGIDIDDVVDRDIAYLRTSYDFTDNITGYIEGQYSYTRTTNTASPNREYGTLDISADNAFLPASLRQQLLASGQSSFVMGSTNADMGRFLGDYRRTVSRITGGLDGKFDVFGTNWKWDGYIQEMENSLDPRTYNDGITSNYFNAIDSVSVNGVPTCANRDPSCVPYNLFGTGVNSAAALAYVEGVASMHQVLRQDVGAVNVNGEPFHSWAGPVSIAVGAEHRIEEASGFTDAIDNATNFFAGNYHPTNGRYSVSEGYLETVVPLARDLPGAQELDLNGAVRATDYSTSGYVTTWKGGLTWRPIQDLRFRFTESRDIRAPNLGELFAQGQTGSGNVFLDPFRATKGVPETVPNGFTLAKGNPELQPEKADTTGFGVVMAPRFMPGFQASVDYYNIRISGAVQTANAQQEIDLCYQGNATDCSAIVRNPLAAGDPFSLGKIFEVITAPENLIEQKTSGIDIDASYRVPMSNLVGSMNGNMVVRAMVNYVLSLETTATNGTVFDGNGVLGGWAGISPFAGLTTPTTQGLLSVAYQGEPVTITAIFHYTGPGVYGNGFINCSDNCPVSTSAAPTFGNNHIAGMETIDLTASYHFSAPDIELYGTVENLTDHQPPNIGGSIGSANWNGQGNQAYDRIGRQFRVGVRFKL